MQWLGQQHYSSAARNVHAGCNKTCSMYFSSHNAGSLSCKQNLKIRSGYTLFNALAICNGRC